MKFEKHKCNECERETSDTYDVPGWIIFNKTNPETNLEITIVKERRSERCSKTAFKHVTISERPLEFCSLECMVCFFEGMMEKDR